MFIKYLIRISTQIFCKKKKNKCTWRYITVLIANLVDEFPVV